MTTATNADEAASAQTSPGVETHAQATQRLAETLYGADDGSGTLNVSRADTVARGLFASGRMQAVASNHREDVAEIDEEISQVTRLLHTDFAEQDVDALKRALHPYLERPRTFERTPEARETAQAAATRNLRAQHGLAGSQRVLADARVAFARMERTWPGIRRLAESGMGDDADVITEFARIARAKGWTSAQGKG